MSSTPIPTTPPDPFQLRGRPRTRPVPKKYEDWTEEERQAYREYISKVRSAVGRLGGYGTHKVPKQGRQKQTTILCSREDHETFRIFSRAKGLSIAGLMREYAAAIRASPRYAHLFDNGPQTKETTDD